jgi:hypothetical protein
LLVVLVFLADVEVEVVPVPAFLVVDVAVVFFEVAVVECVVVAAVSCLCAQDATKAVPAMTVTKPRTNFFIMTGFCGLQVRVFNSPANRKQLIQLFS